MAAVLTFEELYRQDTDNTPDDHTVFTDAANATYDAVQTATVKLDAFILANRHTLHAIEWFNELNDIANELTDSTTPLHPYTTPLA